MCVMSCCVVHLHPGEKAPRGHGTLCDVGWVLDVGTVKPVAFAAVQTPKPHSGLEKKKKRCDCFGLHLGNALLTLGLNDLIVQI